MLMLALRLIFTDKGCKQHFNINCWFKPGVWDIFEIEGASEKDALKWRIEAPLYTLYRGFKKILCKAYLLFLVVFWLQKEFYKASFSFIPGLLNFSDLPNYGSNSRKRFVKVSGEEHRG